MWLRSLLLLMVLPCGVSAQRFLREGFSNQMESDFKGEMALDESEAASGMTREMFLMQDVEWELQKIDFSSVKDSKLRNHLQGFFKDPLKLKLSKRKGKYGLRAMAQMESGKRLRAFWRQAGGGSRLPASELVNVDYDEAVKSRLSTLEFEIQVPPVEKKSRQLPSVVVSVPIEPGTMNGKAIVPRGAGSVKVLPIGHIEGSTPKLEVGRAHVSLPMKAGLVDPSWARGREIFRKGRPTGMV